jgi:hypothetical protein
MRLVCVCRLPECSFLGNALAQIVKEHASFKGEKTNTKRKFLTDKKNYRNITGNAIVEGVTCRQANWPSRDGRSIVFILTNNSLF